MPSAITAEFRPLVIDNLKAGVIQADWFDPDLNPKLEELARHYGTVILPTKPAMPRHKDKVEAGVKYAQNNAVEGRTFESLAAQNAFLAECEHNVTDTRIHGIQRGSRIMLDAKCGCARKHGSSAFTKPGGNRLPSMQWLPIGSGMIESGHRHVLHARLKEPGTAWLQTMLRVLRANGQWASLWN